jgi:hypothetical protein
MDYRFPPPPPALTCEEVEIGTMSAKQEITAKKVTAKAGR